ncbi:DUF2927 domain-containing protein [Paracoccus sp. TK19116]|uniref:DUF2927 domain-containing protein n=1 Tax=Paracoccus albicereus TaxID=2922394 RepID=A0ABT1MR79_9RHOB|nr:DUF2927 domain-containing protein [Paracoccus albicereus]MCQ0970644.1 DUF2927 domain-containing protein [Paracoccus albicereus]
MICAGWLRIAGTASLACALAACAPEPEASSDVSAESPVVSAVEPDSRPTQAELRQARAEAARAANRAADGASTAASDNIAVFLRGAESDLIRRGKLRTEIAPDDVPFTADSLARDFLAVALRDEYGSDGTGGPAPLRRWSAPVRIQPVFGEASGTATRARDRAALADYAARLQSASGHPVGLTASGGNFLVLILTEDERRTIGPRLAELLPGIPPGDITRLQGLAPGNYCTVFAYSRGGDAVYSNAVALIRDELPPRLRASCIQEELAQGMGLANDSYESRPSIFNDDEEFALLTRHDELLLQMLYDPRLRPGMAEAEAAPIVRQIAAELVPAAN